MAQYGNLQTEDEQGSTTKHVSWDASLMQTCFHGNATEEQKQEFQECVVLDNSSTISILEI